MDKHGPDLEAKRFIYLQVGKRSDQQLQYDSFQ
jgi:hypothetical protein